MDDKNNRLSCLKVYKILTLDYYRSFPDKSGFEHSRYTQGNDVGHDSGWCHRCQKW